MVRIIAILIFCLSASTAAAEIAPLKPKNYAKPTTANEYIRTFRDEIAALGKQCAADMKGTAYYQCMDQTAVKRHPATVRRSDEALQIQTKAELKSYRTPVATDAGQAGIYQYYLYGYLKSINQYLIFADGANKQYFLFLDKNSGKETPLLSSVLYDDLPLFDPSGSLLLDTGINPRYQTPDGIRVYRYRPGRGFSDVPAEYESCSFTDEDPKNRQKIGFDWISPTEFKSAVTYQNGRERECRYTLRGRRAS